MLEWNMWRKRLMYKVHHGDSHFAFPERCQILNFFFRIFFIFPFEKYRLFSWIFKKTEEYGFVFFLHLFWPTLFWSICRSHVECLQFHSEKMIQDTRKNSSIDKTKITVINYFFLHNSEVPFFEIFWFLGECFEVFIAYLLTWRPARRILEFGRVLKAIFCSWLKPLFWL